jgi:hypothetical protein
MLFFVVPFAGDDPVGATYATASMVTFAVMTSNLFGYGVGVASDRAEPWDPYTRTLPAGPGPASADASWPAGHDVAVVAAGGHHRGPVHRGPHDRGRPGPRCRRGLPGRRPFTLLGLAIGYACR